MGGLGCDNMTVILVCLLQNRTTWDGLQKMCGRPRPGTPPLEDDEGSAQAFVTPPPTPAARDPGVHNTPEERMPVPLKRDDTSILAPESDGDQQVPEVIREGGSSPREQTPHDEDDGPPMVFAPEQTTEDSTNVSESTSEGHLSSQSQ